MIAHAIFFYVFSIIAVISAIMVTVSKNTVHSVFFLILDFISISCLFIMIGEEFLGIIMLIVYVGAVDATPTSPAAMAAGPTIAAARRESAGGAPQPLDQPQPPTAPSSAAA